MFCHTYVTSLPLYFPPKTFKFFIFFLAVLGLRCCADFSLAAASEGCSLLRCVGFSLRWLLLAEHRLLGARASVAAGCGLNCPAVCGVSWVRD